MASGSVQDMVSILKISSLLKPVVRTTFVCTSPFPQPQKENSSMPHSTHRKNRLSNRLIFFFFMLQASSKYFLPH